MARTEQWGFDASPSKTFPVAKGVSLELRAEGFNALNHHNLFLQEGQNDVANYNTGDPNYTPLPPQIIASKGGIGNNGGANDERRFGQFAAKIDFVGHKSRDCFGGLPSFFAWVSD